MHAIKYNVVQHITVQYSTVQYSTVQYSTVQYSTVQYSTVLSSTSVVNMQGLHLVLPLYLSSCQIPHFSHPESFLPHFLIQPHPSPFSHTSIHPPFSHPVQFLPPLSSSPIPPLSCILPPLNVLQFPPPPIFLLLSSFPIFLSTCSHHPPIILPFSLPSPPILLLSNYHFDLPSFTPTLFRQMDAPIQYIPRNKIKMYIEANLQGRIF